MKNCTDAKKRFGEKPDKPGGAGRPNQASPPCATYFGLIAGGQGRSADDVLQAACAATTTLAAGCLLALGCLLFVSPSGNPLDELALTGGSLFGVNGHCYAKVDHVRLSQCEF